MTRSYSTTDIKILFSQSGNLCSFPGCNQLLVEEESVADDAAVVGEIAHIVSWSDEGPRADPSIDLVMRNKHNNLILLCPTHHTIIDKQDATYSVDTLLEWKTQHLRWVKARLTEDLDAIGYPELEFICQAIADEDPAPSTGLSAVPPSEKLERNELTEYSATYLNVGLLRAPLVSRYLEKVASIDSNFPNRLRRGFIKEYENRKQSGASGDELFLGLVTWGTDVKSSGLSPFKRHASVLAVVAHLFQICEVFT